MKRVGVFLVVCPLLALAWLESSLHSAGHLTTPPRIDCYFENWAIYRPGVGIYRLDDIPVLFCTHMHYAFIGLNATTWGVLILDEWFDVIQDGLRGFNNLTRKNPGLKTSVAIGGWNEGGKKYSEMVAVKERRTAFIQSLIDFCNKYGFGGVLLDWEYPGAADRDGAPADKDNFLSLVVELREAFDAVGKGWEIAIAVAVTKTRVQDGYHVKELCKHVDAVHAMTYDLRGSWDGKTYCHTPLFNTSCDSAAFQDLNVKAGMELWLSNGCPASKLSMGIGFYGRTFSVLADTTNPEPCTAVNTAVGAGEPGEYTREGGVLAYYEICARVQNKTSPWPKKEIQGAKCSYAYQGNQWVGFDDKVDIEEKMKHIREKGYAGASIWTIGMDDFRGLCGEKNLLLTTINEGLKGYRVPHPPHSTAA
ncbi:endochitinase-like [Ischnura elegans]|uniref:endochitinase-like n=1 Tax=Ischnura elegans TaxID=197161 RepID=UPI001ED88AAB|nr:endochitinase-like [Ischnura elegans]